MESERTQIAERESVLGRRLEPADRRYPSALRDVRPPVGPIWIVGEIPERCVTVVGTRRPDLAGLQAARALGRGLAEAGWAVVSGGAVGCDAAAHEGALEAGGRTVVVLASGLERPYPMENIGLFRRAARAGALLSPFEPQVEARPGQFHRRNRLLAGLGAATVVVRAGEHSGALSTALHARRIGRPVLVVPGSTISPSARGSNALLRDGCAAVLESADVVRGLSGGVPPAAGPRAGYPGRSRRSFGARGSGAGRDGVRRAALSCGEDELLALLGSGEPAGADELAEACGLPAEEVAARLGRLEAEGRVVRTADGRFRAVGLGG